MADIISTVFRRKKVNFSKLEPFGFQLEGGYYLYRKTFQDCDLQLTVRISPLGEIFSQIIDLTSQEPYTLHLAESAVGSFVGSVKSQYEETLLEIAEQCFEPDIFKTQQAKALIEYVRAAYGDELEFLWQKFPDNAVWRRKDNQKWYGIILTVSRRRLGLPSDEIVEIIDLRLDPSEMEKTVDGQKYFPGWHMNKKHWYTMILDGSVELDELRRRVDESYSLAMRIS